MQFTIITFGKIKNSELKELENYYFKLSKKFFKINIIEKKDVSNRAVSFVDVEKYFKNAFPIVLSNEGQEFFTKEFCQEIVKWKQDSQKVNFIIGNAFGFTEEVKVNARLLLSLSKFTFPHEVTRVLLLEQLFRCGDILSGGKYHK